MEFNEAIQNLEQFKDTDDYKSYIGGLNPLSADRVTEYLTTEDGKKFIQPTLDKYHSKGLESWKTNNLEKMITEEIGKRYPEADPKDVELKKLQAEINNIKNEATRKDLTNKALKIATEKNLPIDIIDFMIGNDEETTLKNLDTFSTIFNAKLTEMVDKKFTDNTHVPPDDKSKPLSGVEKVFYEMNANLK